MIAPPTFFTVVGFLVGAYAQSPIDNGTTIQPLTVQDQPSTTIEQVASGPGLPGPLAMKQTFAKYGKPVPNVVINAAASQTGSVRASNLPYDQAYLSPVKVGTQTLMLDFDTGSSDLWVFSKALPASEQTDHTLYQLEGTKAKGETWDISYGDGSGARGTVYADKVVVGGVTATIQAVEAATSVSTSFVNGYNDGLLGLGFDAGNTCSPSQCYTFMHQVGPSLPANLFTATLRKGAPGRYDFGFIDKSKHTGTIAYSPINHSGSGNPAYWEFIAGGYSIGSGTKVNRQMDSIADTGTSLAYLDAAVVQAFYAQVPDAQNSAAQGGWILPCDATPPTLSIYSGGAKHTMPGSNALYAPLNNPAGYCFGGVQSNTGIGFSILGDVFLKSQFVVFDIANNRVGFAQQA